ncbi:ferredoxin [Loigolactobacillus rennini]|nr:ferredoxin [Loigolactobacillus rennini]
MMYYCRVQREACIACGLCQLHAPHLFNYDHAGIAYYQPDHNQGNHPVPSRELAAFKQAQRDCPTGAIKRQNKPYSVE